MTPFELEAGLDDSKNTIDSDGTRSGRVKIVSTETLLSAFDSSNKQCRINVYNVTMSNQAAPFILVKLLELDDNSSLNDVNRSFKWQPIHLINENNNNNNNDSEKEEDWESEYDSLNNVIRRKFRIDLSSNFSLVQAKQGKDIDCDELECIWTDLNDKYNDDDDGNGNIKSDVYDTLQVILDRRRDNAMKFTTNTPQNDEYDHKLIEEVRFIFILLHLLFKRAKKKKKKKLQKQGYFCNNAFLILLLFFPLLSHRNVFDLFLTCTFLNQKNAQMCSKTLRNESFAVKPNWLSLEW